MKIFKIFGQIDDAPEKYLEHYYGNKYKTMVGFVGGVVVSVIICFLSSMGLYYHFSNYPERRAFIILQNMEKQKISVYSQPLLNNYSIKEWVSRAIREMYSMDQLTYQEQLEKSAKYFTPDAYALFLERMNATMVKNIIDKKAVANTMVNAPPTIFQTSYSGQTKIWKVKVPITTVYEGAFGQKSSIVINSNVHLTLVSIKTTENYRGLAITQLTFVGS